MKIGYSVEGATDRALVRGLRERWCPYAELVEGHFRGTTGQSRRRELARICEELALKGADVLLLLSDANGRPWREVLREERALVPDLRHEQAIVAVADRNVECWLCADRGYVSATVGKPGAAFDVADPKGPLESALGITRANRQEPQIASFVKEAPLHEWLKNESFRDFYEQARRMSQRLGCPIQNLLERQR